MRRRRIRRRAPGRAWRARKGPFVPAAALALSALLAAAAFALFVPVDVASDVGGTLSATAAKWWHDGWRHVVEEGAGTLPSGQGGQKGELDLPRYWLGQGLPSPASGGSSDDGGMPGGVEARSLIGRLLDVDVDDPRAVLARNLPSVGRSPAAPLPPADSQPVPKPVPPEAHDGDREPVPEHDHSAELRSVPEPVHPAEPRPIPERVRPAEPRPVPEDSPVEAEAPAVIVADEGGEGGGEAASFLQRGVVPENAWMAGIRRSVSWGDGPLVAIYHSHTSEMYRTDHFAPAHPDEYHRFNSVDTGIVQVGEAVATRLRGYGIGVVHSRRIHDWPVHALAYRRSRETAQQLIERYPTLRIILDIHRDSPEGLTAVVAGRPVGRVMIVIGSGESGRVGPNPTWRENLALARGLEAIMNHRFPGLHRRTWVRQDARFNQDLHPGMLLLEIGSYDTHIDEALSAAQLVGDAIAEWLWRQRAGSPD